MALSLSAGDRYRAPRTSGGGVLGSVELQIPAGAQLPGVFVEMFLEYDGADADSARQLVAQQAEQWELSASSLLSWLDRGAALLPDGAVATVQISYHPADRLLSFDMWTGGRSLFGLDDLV